MSPKEDPLTTTAEVYTTIPFIEIVHNEEPTLDCDWEEDFTLPPVGCFSYHRAFTQYPTLPKESKKSQRPSISKLLHQKTLPYGEHDPPAQPRAPRKKRSSKAIFTHEKNQNSPLRPRTLFFQKSNCQILPDGMGSIMTINQNNHFFICPKCEEAFSLFVERKRHARIFPKESTLRCSSCPKTFTFLCELNHHLKSHTSKQNVRKKRSPLKKKKRPSLKKEAHT